MTDVANNFPDKSRQLLLSEHRPVIQQYLAHLEDADVWWRPNESSNRAGQG